MRAIFILIIGHNIRHGRAKISLYNHRYFFLGNASILLLDHRSIAEQ